MILSWTGARLEGGQYEKANVNATDNHNSTCMHAAAAAGMKICVEVRGRGRVAAPVSGDLSLVGSADHSPPGDARLTPRDQPSPPERLFCV